MEVYDCIRSRRTVRNFKADPVPRRIMNRILRAGSGRLAEHWQAREIRRRPRLILVQFCPLDKVHF